MTRPGQFIAIYLGFQGDFFGVPTENIPIFSGGLTYSTIVESYEQQGGSNIWGKLFGPKLRSSQRFVEVQGPGGNGLVKFGLEEDQIQGQEKGGT